MRDWIGMAKSVMRARSIDPDLVLPRSLGLTLMAHGMTQIGQRKYAAGFEILAQGTRAGIPSGMGRSQLKELLKSGVIHLAIETRPEDWTGSNWRAKALSLRPTASLAKQALADIDVVVAASEVPRWLLAEARVLRTTLWFAAGGVPLLLAEVDRETRSIQCPGGFAGGW